MKTKRFFIATLLVVAATSIAVVSCKKETQNVLSNNTPQSVKTFIAPQIDDMKAYIKDFRQKMEDSQNSKDAEYLSFEEAAWHLSCLANIDFCKVNVEYDDFQFDTIDVQVNVTNGVMLMSDLYMAYEQMCTEIQQFKKRFNHLDQNLYFIKVYIGTEGNAKIALKTSYTTDSKGLFDHQWYFQDFFVAAYACGEHFSEDSIYVWNTSGKDRLYCVLNLYEHHENVYNGPGGVATICYVPTRDHHFDYTNTRDPYGSEFFYINDSRVFAKRFYNTNNPYYEFDMLEMCYLLDSYLGLGYDYISDNLYPNEFPVNWDITPITFKNQTPNTPYFKYTYIYHDLYVEYGRSYNVN